MTSFRGALRGLHRWSGLTVALLFLLQAITGILWANQEALTPVLHPEARLMATGERAPLDDLLNAIRARSPQASLDRIAFPATDRVAAVARVRTAQRNIEILLIDPASGRILSAGPIWAYPEQLAERIHGSLMLGRTGHWVVFGEGLSLVVMASSGLAVWWPGLARLPSALTLRADAPPRRRLRELHLVPGAWAATFLLVSGLTGALMAVEPLTADLVSRVAPLAPEKEPLLAPAGPPALSAQAALDALQARFPSARLIKVRTAGPADQAVIGVFVDPQARNPQAYDSASVDRVSGALTVLTDARGRALGDAAIAWLAPIHDGEIYGPFRPVIITTVGLALIAVMLTGLANWLARQGGRRR